MMKYLVSLYKLTQTDLRLLSCTFFFFFLNGITVLEHRFVQLGKEHFSQMFEFREFQ